MKENLEVQDAHVNYEGVFQLYLITHFINLVSVETCVSLECVK